MPADVKEVKRIKYDFYSHLTIFTPGSYNKNRYLYKMRSILHMKWMIASDLHGSAIIMHNKCIKAFEREQSRPAAVCWGIFCITAPATTCRRAMPRRR